MAKEKRYIEIEIEVEVELDKVEECFYMISEEWENYAKIRNDLYDYGSYITRVTGPYSISRHVMEEKK